MFCKMPDLSVLVFLWLFLISWKIQEPVHYPYWTPQLYHVICNLWCSWCYWYWPLTWSYSVLPQGGAVELLTNFRLWLGFKKHSVIQFQIGNYTFHFLMCVFLHTSTVCGAQCCDVRTLKQQYLELETVGVVIIDHTFHCQSWI